jgi:hypothetical protein
MMTYSECENLTYMRHSCGLETWLRHRIFCPSGTPIRSAEVRALEVLLFPLLEAQTGAHRATTRMRSEHRQIERALDRFDERRRITDRATILQSHEQEVQMRELFESHCHKEEATLYPAMDIAFNPKEKSNLLPVIQAFEI